MIDSPSTVILRCDDLSSPANGEVSQPDNTVGSVAKYTCSEGYDLIGESTRVCQDDQE